eukprot:CAMPEP_0119486624 /NCGR_PEP_ID=MMETSP1344-20130328/12973_1 /TAXON_ID=236787 /ORGANISM="Florenciella parvula, Strain CCMP2471" /LENGTH=256 /DNA_ID=CAMNT_0007521409 /DNA_START=14 /DNA_END=782 /DNA_ORIENTATION=-
MTERRGGAAGEVRKCLAEVKALLKSVAPRPASDSKDKNGAASKEKSPRRLVSKLTKRLLRSPAAAEHFTSGGDGSPVALLCDMLKQLVAASPAPVMNRRHAASQKAAAASEAAAASQAQQMAMAAIYGIPMQVPPRMSVERKSAPAPSASDLAALENQRLIVALLHFMALLAFEGGDSGGGGHRGGGGNTEGVEKAAAYREAEPLLNHDQSSNGNPDGAPPSALSQAQAHSVEGAAMTADVVVAAGAAVAAVGAVA